MKPPNSGRFFWEWGHFHYFLIGKPPNSEHYFNLYLKIISIHIRVYCRNNVITITNSLCDDKITMNSVIVETVMSIMTKVCHLVTVFNMMTTFKRKQLSLHDKVGILDYRRKNTD